MNRVSASEPHGLHAIKVMCGGTEEKGENEGEVRAKFAALNYLCEALDGSGRVRAVHTE